MLILGCDIGSETHYIRAVDTRGRELSKSVFSLSNNNGIGVVQVNPYAVKQTKELEDNSRNKDDRKDPKRIVNLVKDGNHGMPYLLEGLYADLRRLSMFRDQLAEDRIHREMKICFSEYIDAFGKLDGAFTLVILRKASLPKDILALGAEGLKSIWHEAKLRGCGYGRVDEIVRYAGKSVGLTEGVDAGREAVRWFAKKTVELTKQLAEAEDVLHCRCR